MEIDADIGESVGRYVGLRKIGSVRVITLARPERTNALVPELLDGVRECIVRINADDDVRAVVLTAVGRHFSTGGDVAAFAARDGEGLAAYAREIVGSLNSMILDLMRLDVPVVCAARGAVTGGALGFILASDVVVLSPDAFLAPYYVDVGFSPDGGWTAILPQRVGRIRAAMIQYANEPVDPERAVEWGLATAVANDTEETALQLAQTYASKKAGAVARTKALLREEMSRVQARLDNELANFVEQIQTDEARAGMNDFLAGRGMRAGGK